MCITSSITYSVTDARTHTKLYLKCFRDDLKKIMKPAGWVHDNPVFHKKKRYGPKMLYFLSKTMVRRGKEQRRRGSLF